MKTKQNSECYTDQRKESSSKDVKTSASTLPNIDNSSKMRYLGKLLPQTMVRTYDSLPMNQQHSQKQQITTPDWQKKPLKHPGTVLGTNSN